MTTKSLELLLALFNEQSSLQLPVGVSEQVIEIREWVNAQLGSMQVTQAKKNESKNKLPA